MYNSNKQPNSKGSIYNAYKLSSIDLTNTVEHQDTCFQLAIGCDNDDLFLEMGDQERLKVYVEVLHPNTMTSFDLEDFLKEAKRLCPQLF